MVRQEQLLPISTRVCAVCGELDRGIYLTEKKKSYFYSYRFFTKQLLLQEGMSKEGRKNYPYWQWLISDCIKCLYKENIYLCHLSKIKESEHRSSEFTPILPSLLNP